MQGQNKSLQAELTREKNTQIRFIDTMVRNKRQRPYHNFKKADVFRKIPVLLALYQHKLHGSLGDTNDELMYDPDVSVQKQTCYNCIGVYFQALMKSPFMKEQPGYACITTSPERLRESFINIGFWAEGAPLPRLGSREVQDLADLAVFLGVQNASYEMFVSYVNGSNSASTDGVELKLGV